MFVAVASISIDLTKGPLSIDTSLTLFDCDVKTFLLENIVAIGETSFGYYGYTLNAIRFDEINEVV